jgi:hypothetical protein
VYYGFFCSALYTRGGMGEKKAKKSLTCIGF